MKKIKDQVMALPDALLQHSRNRSTEFVKKIREAMQKIELDIEQNDGLYPFNGGRLTQAELCRRAGVTNVALQGAAHKHTTRIMVEAWLKTVTAGITTGRKAVRRAVTDRAENWKAQHKAIGTAYHITVLEMIEMKRRILELEQENVALREQLTLRGKTKVTALPTKK